MILIHSLPLPTPLRAPCSGLHSLHVLPNLLLREPTLYQALILPRSECWVKVRAERLRIVVSTLKQFMAKYSETGCELQKLLYNRRLSSRDTATVP